MVLIFISAVSGPFLKEVSAQSQNGGNQQNMCLYDNQWYPPGSVINMGRSDNWCYGAYCGQDKTVKYWDDYTCPLPTADNPSPQIPDHVQNEIKQILNPQLAQENNAQQQSPVAERQTVFGTQMFGDVPLFPPEQITAPPPPTTQSSSFFDIPGCWYRDRFFWPGSDIFNTRNGNRCMGAYCDWKSQVQHWEDSCGVTIPPPPRPRVDRT